MNTRKQKKMDLGCDGLSEWNPIEIFPSNPFSNYGFYSKASVNKIIPYDVETIYPYIAYLPNEVWRFCDGYPTFDDLTLDL